ncbi:hypothetical protein [Pseudoalteromonas sp. APC 3355]|uniref:hypothetical protein n=1 Tax=Pseudoalteromonas sp. APC 3355 TaxID=3035199 RepID=UPI0025B604D0|nr:hypothetical protein [Pseudoalteromonas sp. APC 3355]MDN3474936.1 hypothetical protein [Pseudoalteromonas sp. APC 3355]
MVSWNFKSLKSRIQEQVSDTDYKRLDQYMDAFDWKGKAVGFHLNEAHVCFEKFSDCSLDNYIAQMNKLVNKVPFPEFHSAKAKREVSIVSAAMMVHSLPETLAQILVICFQLPANNIHRITFKSVHDSMRQSKIKEMLLNLITSDEYRYINAFVNTSKHISLVKPMYSFAFDGTTVHSISFDEFSFQGTNFKSIRDEVLIDYIQKLRTACVEIGAEINTNNHQV